MEQTVRIVNRTRGTLLAQRLEVADSWWRRLRGYLGRGKPLSGEGLLLVPCSAVHTYGMAFGLDVIFLDATGRVLQVLPEMEPWKRSHRVRDARYVLELPEGTIEATGTMVGDILSWTSSRPSSRFIQETS